MSRRPGELGCCGCLLRILLGLINLLILGIGIALVVLGSLFKWSNVFDFIKKFEGLENFISVNTLDTTVIVIIVIGAVLTVVALVGFIATATLNRLFLGLYELFLIVIFLANLGALIALLVLRPKFEETIKTEFDKVVDKIINASSYGIESNQLDIAYKALKAISQTFQCCGKICLKNILVGFLFSKNVI